MSAENKKPTVTVGVTITVTGSPPVYTFSYSGGSDGKGNVTVTQETDVGYQLSDSTQKLGFRWVGALFLNPGDSDIGRIKLSEKGSLMLIRDRYCSPSDTISFRLVAQYGSSLSPVISPDPQIINKP